MSMIIITNRSICLDEQLIVVKVNDQCKERLDEHKCRSIFNSCLCLSFSSSLNIFRFKQDCFLYTEKRRRRENVKKKKNEQQRKKREKKRQNTHKQDNELLLSFTATSVTPNKLFEITKRTASAATATTTTTIAASCLFS